MHRRSRGGDYDLVASATQPRRRDLLRRRCVGLPWLGSAVIATGNESVPSIPDQPSKGITDSRTRNVRVTWAVALGVTVM